MPFVELSRHDCQHASATVALRFSHTGDNFATAASNGGVQIWQTGAGAKLDIQAHSQGVNEISWSLGGAHVATASDDTTIGIWDVYTGKAVLRPLRGHASVAFSAAYCPYNSDVLASGGYDEFIRLWDTRTGSAIRPIAAHSEPVTAVDWSPDGQLLASSSYDGTVRIWDAASGHCVKTLHETDLPPVVHVCWSPGGRHVLTAALDSTLRLWDVFSGERVKTYTGHVNDSLCVRARFVEGSGGEQLIACGSEDGRVLMWDVNTRQVVQTLAQPTAASPTASGQEPRQGPAGSGTTASSRTAKIDAAGSAGEGVRSPGQAKKRARTGAGAASTTEGGNGQAEGTASALARPQASPTAATAPAPVLSLDVHPTADIMASAAAVGLPADGPRGVVVLWDDDARGLGRSVLQQR